MEAVESNDISLVGAILDSGTQPIPVHQYDASPLIRASDENHLEMARLLIEYGATVNYQDDAGDTPLICAVVIGSIPIVGLLIKHGADVNYKNNLGSNALGYAKHYKNSKIINLLLEAGAQDE